MQTLAKLNTFDFQEWKQKLQHQKPEMPIGVRLIDMHEIVMKTGYSRSTINRWRKAGTFPYGQQFPLSIGNQSLAGLRGL